MTDTPETPDAQDWSVLADYLMVPDQPADVTRYELHLNDQGYHQPDGTWVPRVHTLTVGLHPYGLGGSGPMGYAYCTCEWWHEGNWRTAKTPTMLAYGELATWIAGHARDTEAHAVAKQMAGVSVLVSLRT
jgi:hypothetical protein